MSAEEVRTIEIICSSPRHARGKVAKIATFIRRHPQEENRRNWQSRGPLQSRRMGRTADGLDRRIPPSQRGDEYEYAMRPMIHEMLQPLRCKLCGITRPEPSDAELEMIVRQGKSSIELSQLGTGSI